MGQKKKLSSDQRTKFYRQYQSNCNPINTCILWCVRTVMSSQLLRSLILWRCGASGKILDRILMPVFNKKLSARIARYHTQSDLRKAASASATKLAEPRRAAGAMVQAYQPSRNDQTEHNLIVEFGDDQRLEFPLVWLRDNCQCTKCFHPKSNSRIIDWELFDVEATQFPQSTTLSEDGTKLAITWNDGHRSEFTSEWLMERNFTEENCQQYSEDWYRPRPRLWSKQQFEQVLNHFQYEDVINCNATLLEWVEALIHHGVVMIHDAPLAEMECRRLAERVGFIRKTHYGEEYMIKAKEGTSNVAYLSAPLQMHTDLPYYDYLPGCNLLHCLVQSESQGGRNLLCDAFYVAERMRQEFPVEFKALSETLVNWSDLGEDEGWQFHSIYRAPVICIGRDGNVERINHSIPQRDSFFNVPLSNVEGWYRALTQFVRLIHREAVRFKTAPGDILAFSNVRMLHGRSGYTDTVANTRHVVGAFLDWDEIYSRWRVLKGMVPKNGL
ncbi:gamma-butyrobetaine dioxygenase-like [Wyeomyia smithii]|uniref:gamma-butyrobetaine dioxygenase-like n=1 Tax=Wyeomyia smithii TaxID=174621 RepID=UPI002467E03D|nr:gamma-butyrobetaine dioxygenase-like [Wyeomyia smithii]